MISRAPTRQELVAGVVINKVALTPLGGKPYDLSNSILSIAYFENIFALNFTQSKFEQTWSHDNHKVLNLCLQIRAFGHTIN